MSINFRNVRTPAMFSNIFNSFIGKSMSGSSSEQGTIEYEKLKQSIAESTILIKNNINRIEKFNSICGKPSDCIAKRKQIFEIKNSVIIKTEATCKDLRAIYNLAKHDEKKLKLEVEILIKEFKGVVKSFFLVQKKFLFNVKKNPLKDEPPNYEALVTRKSNLWNRKLNIVEVEIDDDVGAGPSAESSNDQGKQQAQKEFVVVPESIEELRRRQEAFEHLQADMVDINAMMKEMGQMVITQGEGITGIEESVEETVVHVEETTQLLREARQYSDKRHLRVAAIGGSIILIILLIVLLKIFI